MIIAERENELSVQTTNHGIENIELLFTKLMNFHWRYFVCCEIRHDFRIGQRSIQRFTSG